MMPQKKNLHWDGTVTAGNVLTALTLMIGLFAWGMRLEGRVDRQEDRQQRFETITAQHRQEDRQAELAALNDLRQALRRIEDILLQQARDVQPRRYSNP
jgi:Tfp pilus assembly protein PilO